MSKPVVRPQRADWRRNHEQLVAAAATLVARDGAQVSLEEVARVAGVGSATLHRHFPSRRALLEEVFAGAVERLRRRAEELAAGDPCVALDTWMEDLTLAAAETRGLAESLASGAVDGDPTDGCHAVVRGSTAMVLERARTVSAVRPGVEVDDILALTEAVALVTADDPHAARRLVRLVLDGVRPSRD